jgi:hypothetical protein
LLPFLAGLIDPRVLDGDIGVLPPLPARRCSRFFALGSGEEIEIVALGPFGVLGEIAAALEQELKRHGGT